MTEPTTPLTAREFFSQPRTPYIPELHRDDCEDVACARCADPAPLPPERESQLRALLTAGEALSPNAGWALLDELDRTRAEHEPYEMLTEQGCEAGKHPTWLVDSPDHHACPWCALERVAAERDRAVRAFDSLAQKHDKAKTERDEVLRIVSDWCIEANDSGGLDATDLAFRLEHAGHQLPDEETAAPAEDGDADSDAFQLISEISSSLRDATDEGEYHAVGLIYDLANGMTTVAEARAEFAELTLRHV